MGQRVWGLWRLQVRLVKAIKPIGTLEALSSEEGRFVKIGCDQHNI